jgi:WD40 repeat protein
LASASHYEAGDGSCGVEFFAQFSPRPGVVCGQGETEINMTPTFAKTTFGLLAFMTLGCGPGVHLDPTLLGTGGQGPAPPLEVQQITPLDMTPYDSQPGRTFRACGTLGEGQALSQAYSLDGTLLALGYTSGMVKLYRTSDLTLVTTFAKASTAIVSLQFSPDGALLASVSSDNPSIEVWRVSDGATVSRVKSGGFYSRLRFSGNGRYLGVTGTEAVAYPVYTTINTVSIRSVADGNEICQISGDYLLNFSTDESTAWVAKDNDVLVYDVRTCSVAAGAPAVAVGGGTPFAMSTDGRIVFKYYDAVSDQAPSQVGLPLMMAAVRAVDGQAVWAVPGTGLWPAIDMRLSPKEDFVVISNLDQWKRGDIVLLNAHDGTTTAHLELGSLQSFIAVSPDGATVVTRDSGNDAVFWRAADGVNLGQLPKSALAVPVDSVAFAADSTQLLVASGGQVRFWNLQARTPTRVVAFPLGDATQQGIALSRDNRWLAGWNGTTLAVRSLTADDQNLSWAGMSTTGVSFSSDGQYLYAFSDTNAYPAIRITTNGIGQDPTSISVSSGFETATGHLAVSNQGLLAGLTGGDLASGHITIAQFDGAVVQMIDFVTPSLCGLESLAFSPNGQYLAAGFQFFVEHKYLVMVWRVSDGAVVASFATPDLAPLAFSPDGTMITTSEDVWTWHEGTVVESFLNTYEAYPVVSPDGRTIVTKTAGSSSVTLWCRP